MTDWSATLRALVCDELPDDAARIVDELRALEEITCAGAARQARLAVKLDALRMREQETATDPRPATHAEVALARRVSPHQGRQQLALARILDRELPHTKAAFDAGLISQWRATIIARESACLSTEHRAEVDRVVAADAHELSGLGDRAITGMIRQLAARLDAKAVAERRRRAESERRISIRPAPDAMVYLTALLPVAQGVGVYAALKSAAGTAVGTGAATSLGTAMADELVARATGVAVGRPQPVSLRLTMAHDALLGGIEQPTYLAEHGPVPAGVARALVADNLDAGAKVWLKRLYVRLETGELLAMDSRSRFFPKGLAEFLDLRDRWCRNAYCNAPIRHHDHVEPHEDDGPTSAANGQEVCVACNLAKQAPGWSSRVVPGERHTVEITAPTGHRYRSRAPAL